MTSEAILKEIGEFSDRDLELFEAYSTKRSFRKNEILLKEGQVCQSFYFILSGSFFQFVVKDIDDVIIDLHTEHEWMYNHQSLIAQTTSDTTIKAFSDSAILELTLLHFHYLASRSSAFLQFNRILNPVQNRTYLFDNSLTPVEKYNYIKKARQGVIELFPIKMIASYLKIAPETLSRVRAKY